MARAFDGESAEDRAFARLGVALAKFLGNKLAPGLVYEAMEALGGMGYVEDTGLPLLYREAPLNSIWEGSGNVICLDILRTLRAEPLAGEVLSAELGAASGQLRGYDAAMQAHMARFRKLPDEGEGALVCQQPGHVADRFGADPAGPGGGGRGVCGDTAER